MYPNAVTTLGMSLSKFTLSVIDGCKTNCPQLLKGITITYFAHESKSCLGTTGQFSLVNS